MYPNILPRGYTPLAPPLPGRHDSSAIRPPATTKGPRSAPSLESKPLTRRDGGAACGCRLRCPRVRCDPDDCRGRRCDRRARDARRWKRCFRGRPACRGGRAISCPSSGPTSSTSTLMMSPRFSTSSTLPTRPLATREMCSRPSLPGVSLTNAPKSLMPTTSPSNVSPTSGSLTMPRIMAFAASPAWPRWRRCGWCRPPRC